MKKLLCLSFLLVALAVGAMPPYVVTNFNPVLDTNWNGQVIPKLNVNYNNLVGWLDSLDLTNDLIYTEITNATPMPYSMAVSNTVAGLYRSGSQLVGSSATSTAITFSTPFPVTVGTNYAISFGSANGFATFPNPEWSAKTTNGFTLNTSAIVG